MKVQATPGGVEWEGLRGTLAPEKEGDPEPAARCWARGKAGAPRRSDSFSWDMAWRRESLSKQAPRLVTQRMDALNTFSGK